MTKKSWISDKLLHMGQNDGNGCDLVMRHIFLVFFPAMIEKLKCFNYSKTAIVVIGKNEAFFEDLFLRI